MSPETKIPNNSDIDQALKEFEAKSQAEQASGSPESFKTSEDPQREVSGVKFETDSYKAVKLYEETNAPKIVSLVMKFSGGVIKEQKTAEYILFVFVIIAMAISVYLFFGGNTSNPLPPSAEQLEQARQMQTNR